MNSSKSALAATIIVFVLAVAAAVFAFWYIGGEPETSVEPFLPPQGGGVGFIPTDEQVAEMDEAAERLIRNNREIISLFVTRGLPARPEPYGNAPENGIY